MFDWEDEEITNIIWGEESKFEDHIVPYPAETYGKDNKVSHQEAVNVKLTQKTTVSRNITDWGQENNTQTDAHGRVSTDGFDLLLDLSSSKATKLDHEHTDEKAQVDNVSQIFDNQSEDKDRSNFVDYGWANVGSFDDLDRMLSNHDQELWSSTKDVIGCPENPEMLSMDSPSLNLGDLKSNYQHFGTKSGIIKEEKQTKMKMEKEREGQFINAFPSPHGYNMLKNQHSVGSTSTRQQVLSASSYLSDRGPLGMTPQEKIEKLRRRQQMRALLAIRKQQQEIRQLDDQSLSSLISVDVSSPLEQCDSDARPVMMDKTAMADTVIHQFQNVIAGLGIQMRVCIRDSLFRLAQGALQRRVDGTINKRSNDGASVVMEGVSNTKSSTRTSNAETKTNPIDRVVACLLFHTPPRELVPSPSEATTTTTFDNDNRFSCIVENGTTNDD